MSRIHEALSQAGMKTPSTEGASQRPSGVLEGFPLGSQTEPAGARLLEPLPPIQVPKVPVPSPRNFVERLVVHADVEPYAVEQYRRLAAVLHQAQVERGIRTVMVASAQAGEGKTLTAANLGLTLSESYKRRVLLIDADLRRPSLSSLFQLPTAAGLAESLKAPRERALNLAKISDSLTLLPGGHPDPDPMSGLTSGRMQEIIDQAAENFDWVIIDTPPVALLTDAKLLASMVDAAILVIDAGVTPYVTIQHAVEGIGREKLIGVVLNRVERASLKDGAYYAYYGHAYGNTKVTS